jgi:hypothetical protein
MQFSCIFEKEKKYSPTNRNMLLPIQILLVKGGQVLLKKSSNIKTQKGEHYSKWMDYERAKFIILMGHK